MASGLLLGIKYTITVHYYCYYYYYYYYYYYILARVLIERKIFSQVFC